jgi:hypothetical protein
MTKRANVNAKGAVKDYAALRKKLFRQFWGWVIAAAGFLGGGALVWDMGFQCMSAPFIFLFLVCILMIGITLYGFQVVKDDEEKAEKEDYDKLPRIVEH